jgi:hypothetical protein
LVGIKQVTVAFDSNSDWRVWIKILGFHYTPSAYRHFLPMFLVFGCKYVNSNQVVDYRQYGMWSKWMHYRIAIMLCNCCFVYYRCVYKEHLTLKLDIQI